MRNQGKRNLLGPLHYVSENVLLKRPFSCWGIVLSIMFSRQRNQWLYFILLESNHILGVEESLIQL